MNEVVKKQAAQIVHFHGLWDRKHLALSTRCRRAGIPYVVSPHGMLEPWALRQKKWKKAPWFYLFEKRFLMGASNLLATSEMEAENLGKMLSREKCVALPLGLTSSKQDHFLAARKALGWEESQSVLLFVSRIHPKKGLHTLIEALSALNLPQKKTARLVIIGSGEKGYIRELERMVESQKSNLPAVQWLGEIWGDEKWNYFQGADLFCLPSFSENFGLAVLEALQVGTRVLTSDQTPWTKIGSFGGGFVAQPTVDQVRLALENFFRNPEWPLQRRAELSAEVHRRFSWESVGPAYLRFYEQLLKQRGTETEGPQQ